MKMAWFRQTLRVKKMVLSIAIGLKLTSGALASPKFTSKDSFVVVATI